MQRGLDLVDTGDVQVCELRAQAAGVDNAVAEVPAGKLDVRRQRVTHELRLGVRPRHAGEDADVSALVKAEATRASRDLRDLPRQQVASLLAVELLRLGEQQGLARQVDAV